MQGRVLGRVGGALAAVALAACGGAAPGGAAQEEVIARQADLVRTRAEWTPGPARLSWTGGFSLADVWIGLADGGALRMEGSGAPAPVPELDPAAVGGALSSPVFLDGGEALFTVFTGAQKARLAHWKDGKVDDPTGDLAPDGETFARTLRTLARAPSGEAVAVLEDAKDPTLLRAFGWKAGHFLKSAELQLPADTAIARVTAMSARTFYVLGADTTGSYSIRFFDGTALTTVLENAPQLSGAFLPTSPTTGFVAVQGMSFWDGKTLAPAARPPASPVYLPFAPDGLASVQTESTSQGNLNPRVFLQHATGQGGKLRVGPQEINKRLRWLSAGTAGSALVVVVDGDQPSDPAIVSVDLSAAAP